MARWREFSGFGKDKKFYWFESDEFLTGLRTGNQNMLNDALTFLELDPYYFRSGYMKEKIAERLKRASFDEAQKARLRKILLNTVCSPRAKVEFSSYLKLIPAVCDDRFIESLAALDCSTCGYLLDRKQRALARAATG